MKKFIPLIPFISFLVIASCLLIICALFKVQYVVIYPIKSLPPFEDKIEFTNSIIGAASLVVRSSEEKEISGTVRLLHNDGRIEEFVIGSNTVRTLNSIDHRNILLLLGKNGKEIAISKSNDPIKIEYSFNSKNPLVIGLWGSMAWKDYIIWKYRREKAPRAPRVGPIF